MSNGAVQDRILCVDPGLEVFHQARRLCSGSGTVVEWEKRLGRVLELFERKAYAVLLISSSSLRDEVAVGIELLEVISAKCSATQIIFLVHPRDIKLTAPALRAGTYQYSKLPMSDEELKLVVQTAREHRPDFALNLLLNEQADEVGFEDMVGGCVAMRELYRLIRQAAATNIPVLLTGDTGTGKDLAARAIHSLSRRSLATYHPINLGALPTDLVPSELFGHEKGAFTGASERRLGCFELAHRGTVFLDEISTIDESVQISLLRLLENQELHRIGGNQTVEVDVRIIAASNEDLERAVHRGDFREDLYYRLEVLQIHLPLLRERHGDVPLLVDYYLKRFNAAYKKNILGLASESVALLESYHWPGNVRELKNVLHRAVVLCSGDVLLPEHLPLRLRTSDGGRPMISVPVGTTLAEMEKKLVSRTLAHSGGNRTRAASLLGISRRALYNKIERYGL